MTMVFPVVIALSAFCLSALATTNQISNQVLQIAWDPSASTNVTGYNVYYGGSSRVYTNRIVLGKATNSPITGPPGASFFVAVTARDSAGHESPPCNEITCAFPTQPNSSPPVPGLPIRSLPVAKVAIHAQSKAAALPNKPAALQISSISHTITISAAESVASAWILEASEDLIIWQALATGSNSPVKVTLPDASAPALFFRLRRP